MTILTQQPHPENDNHHETARTAGSPKSILPNTTRGVNGVMTSINDRTDKRFYAPAGRGFWRPPADAQEALARGRKKIRRARERSL